jgi:hypothetical protein
MKTLLSVANGALTVTEDGGKVSLNFDESVGGGAAAGIVKGQGSIVLDANMGLQLGEKLLNSHLPASVQPLAQVIEGVANQAIQAIE